jgi:5'-deoxynucleotidase YfbR-like HD superfamily hydrolase
VVAAGTDLDRAVATWREVMSAEELAAAKRRKHEAEAAGLAQLCAMLQGSLAHELAELWTEYAERRSPEAQFAAEIDKLEALLQAMEYRDAGEPADVENFLQSAREAVSHPVLRRFLGELESHIAGA